MGSWIKRLSIALFAVLLYLHSDIARSEVASIYGGRDGLCGHRTASGERLNCAALTAAHRRFAFGTRVRVCHTGCVTVRINDRGPWVRGRDIDLSPAAAQAIGLTRTDRVTISLQFDAVSLPAKSVALIPVMSRRRSSSSAAARSQASRSSAPASILSLQKPL
jgi:rare lipoprotein A